MYASERAPTAALAASRHLLPNSPISTGPTFNFLTSRRPPSLRRHPDARQ